MTAGQMIVMSTGDARTLPAEARARCLASVAEQVCRAHEHLYLIDPAVSYEANITRTVLTLDPSDIVVCLDADDWLATPTALSQVRRAHDAGAWVTYGSYRFADGRKATWQRAMTRYELANPRRTEWQASHLKTMRAGLIQRLHKGELVLEHGRDLALMFACIEQAGPDRVARIWDEVYVYNWGNSFEFRASPAERAVEQLHVQEIRARVPYARLEAL